MSYRVLALDANSQHMPLAVLRKIRDLVNAGAVVVGPKPIDSPSLSDDQAEFQTIADQLWGSGTGKGKVYGKRPMQGHRRGAGRFSMPRRISNTPSRSRTPACFFVHRKLPTARSTG